MAAASSKTFKIEGVEELQRAVQRIDKGFGREVTKTLRDDIGRPVASDVRGMVSSRGLVQSGALLGSIKPSVRRGVVYIRSSPPLRPGPRSRQGYAPIYEYGGGGTRAFMRPVMDSWVSSGKAEREMEKVLDWAAHRWSG